MSSRQTALFILFLILNHHLVGQTVKGTIAQFDKSLTYQLALFYAKDSTLAKSALCDSVGNFEFSPIKVSTYFLRIQNDLGDFIRIDSISITDAESIRDLGALTLLTAKTNIEGVEITGQKAFITRKADKIVVNPEGMISSSGTSALELLEKVPGVSVDYQGNISLKGKGGVVVFIDNRPTYLSAEELANLLRSTPSNTIESIELMSNPPAKYDASGNAGVINIIMKKQREKGLSGALTLSYGQGRYYRTNNSLNLNYRLNKWNFFSALAWSENNMYQDLDINRYYYDDDGNYVSGFEQNSYIKKQNGGRSLKLGCDWYATKKSTFGVVVSGFYNPLLSEVSNYAEILNSANEPSAFVNAFTRTETKWHNLSVNSNYTLNIDTLGKTMSFNVDYLNYASKENQSLLNQTDSVDGSIINYQNLLANLPQKIEVKTAKLDFVIPMKHQDKFEFGLKTAFVNTNNVADFRDSIGGTVAPNYTFSNEFKFNENNNAAYLSYSRDWNKFSLQVGLRGERIQMNGNQLGNPVVPDSTFSIVYASLFPTLFLSYSPDSLKNHNLVFSAGRRINYPNYDDMNPFTYPLDAYTLYGGNPFLRPTFSYTLEAYYSFKSSVSLGFDYSYVTDLIGETNEQVNGIFYSRPGNFGQQIVYGFNISGELKLAKRCIFQYYSEAKSISYNTTIYNQPLDESKWYVYIGPNFIFPATKKLSFELAGSYQSRILVGQFLTIPVASARFGMAYKLWEGKGTIKLSVNDLFFTNRPGGDIRNIENSTANWLSELDTRVIQLSFSYRFNKGKAMSARSYSASDEEKQRIKTN